MEQKDTFKMTYSARQREEIDQIRQKYVPQEPDKMAQLRALDGSATRKATTAALIVGVVGALLLGTGMSLAMTDIGAPLGAAALPLGIAVGVVGIAILSLAYPLYRRTLQKARTRIAPEILRLTDELTR